LSYGSLSGKVGSTTIKRRRDSEAKVYRY
jgi:hypothetical protein